MAERGYHLRVQYAAAIMADEPVLIENLPDVNDINVMLEAIEGIGAMVLQGSLYQDRMFQQLF